jgi:hypothetical protein
MFHTRPHFLGLVYVEKKDKDAAMKQYQIIKNSRPDLAQKLLALLQPEL